jgi:DNA-binding MarR family transcriptional regulator
MKSELRLWLRMLTCTNLIEAELRRRLRAAFGTTLPRFDLLAALDRAPDGLTLGEISERMMVSNGNITGLHDRRVVRLTLTATGAAIFAEQSAAHAGWLVEIFSGLPPHEREALHRLLGRTKSALVGALEGEDA